MTPEVTSNRFVLISGCLWLEPPETVLDESGELGAEKTRKKKCWLLLVTLCKFYIAIENGHL
jgi:hypothetical protein